MQSKNCSQREMSSNILHCWPVVVLHTVDFVLYVYGERNAIQAFVTLAASEASRMVGLAHCLQNLSEKKKNNKCLWITKSELESAVVVVLAPGVSLSFFSLARIIPNNGLIQLSERDATNLREKGGSLSGSSKENPAKCWRASFWKFSRFWVFSLNCHSGLPFLFFPSLHDSCELKIFTVYCSEFLTMMPF